MLFIYIFCNNVEKLGHLFYDFELKHNKTNKMTCAPSIDSDQPLLFALWQTFIRLTEKKTDKTGLMPRLTRVFARGTCHFVGFVVLQIIFYAYHHTVLK